MKYPSAGDSSHSDVDKATHGAGAGGDEYTSGDDSADISDAEPERSQDSALMSLGCHLRICGTAKDKQSVSYTATRE